MMESKEEIKSNVLKSLDQIKQSFEEVDKNGDDLIDYNELVEFLDKKMGVCYLYREARLLTEKLPKRYLVLSIKTQVVQ